MKRQLWVLAGVLALVVMVPLLAQQQPPGQRGAAQGAVQAPPAPRRARPGRRPARRAGWRPRSRAWTRRGGRTNHERGVAAQDPGGLHAHLQRKGPHRLAHQQVEPPRHHSRLPRPARRHRRNAATVRRRRNPDDGQEVQERRGLHGGQAGLGLRQWVVLLDRRGWRRLPDHARLPAGGHDGGRCVRRAADGRQHERAGLGESHAGAAPGDPDEADRELAEGLEAGSVECRARTDRRESAPHHHVAQ